MRRARRFECLLLLVLLGLLPTFADNSPAAKAVDGKTTAGFLRCGETRVCCHDFGSARKSPDWLAHGAMYQIQLRAFTPEGTLKAAMAKLEHLKSLGVTSVYLWPPTVADDDPDQNGWSPRQVKSGFGNPKNPYRVKDFWHVDPEYGTDDDLRAFVSEAHRLGLYVLLDVVYVHCGPNNPIVREHPEFFRYKDGKMEKTRWNFPLISMERQESRQYFIGNMAYWMKEFGMDGFRCDSSDELPISFWEEARAALERVRPDVVLLAEGRRRENLRKAFDCSYDWEVSRWGVRESLRGAVSAKELRYQHGVSQDGLPAGGLTLHFTANHDLVNDEYENRPEKTLGHDNQAAGLFLVFLLDGVPLLYTGQEICDASRHSLYGRTGVDWSLLATSAARERMALIRRLTALRRDNRAIARAPTVWLDNDRPDEIVSFERCDAGTGRVVALANLSSGPVRVNVSGLKAGSVRPLVQARASAEGGTFLLGPWGFFAGMDL